MNIEFRFDLSYLNLLLLINIVLFLLYFVGGFSQIVSIFILNTNLINNGIFFQLLTFNFIHFSPIHLLFNLIALFNIGSIVNNFYGNKIVLIIYVLGGIFSGLFTVLGSLIQGQQIFTLGASGSVFAMIGLILGGTLKKNRFGIDLPINFSSFIFYVVFAISLGFLPGLNVNNWAHIGGLIFGTIVGLLIDNTLIPQTSNSKFYINIMYVITLILCLFFLINFFTTLLNINLNLI